MAEYGDWIEQDELDQDAAPQQRAPRATPADPNSRKSVVLHLAPPRPNSKAPAPVSRAPPVPAPKPPVPAPKRGPSAPALSPSPPPPAAAEISESPSIFRRPDESRLFPGMSIQTRTEKIKSGKKEEDYAMEWKWPWALLGLFFLAGGIVLAIFGGWCIKQNPSGNSAPPTNELYACGPAGGILICFDLLPRWKMIVSYSLTVFSLLFFLTVVGGGIAMLMCGFLIVLLAIWQLYKLRDHRRRFIGLKEVV